MKNLLANLRRNIAAQHKARTEIPDMPEPRWHDSDALIETTPPPSQEVILYQPPVIEAQVELDQPTLDEFQERVDKKFHALRAKFYRQNGKFAKQWLAAVADAYNYGFTKQNRQVIAPTGQGKTYYLAALLRILIEEFPQRYDFLHPDNHGRIMPVVCVPAKVVAQTIAVFAEYQVQAIVTSLPSLRASLGEMMLDWRTVIVNQMPQLYPFIKMDIATLLLVIDESQGVKNKDSTQSTIIESMAAHGIPVLFMSATPYSRVSQARIIACAIQPKIPNPGGESLPPLTLTNKIWSSFAKWCCPQGYDPQDWSPKALERLQEVLEPYTTRWSIPYNHRIITKTVSCKFATPAEKASYMEVFMEWQAIREQRREDPLTGVIAELVALQKYNQRAEELRAPHLVKAGVELWIEKEKAHQHNAKSKPISVIFGFAHKTSMEIAAEALRRMLGAHEFQRKVAIICGGKDCDNDKDLFQSDKKPFMLLTIAAGGAGLSLDNNSRNRRQRYMFCSAVWNDIQMAQLAGRTQRLDTQSASYMYIMYYEGTEEYNKLQKVRRKVACLKVITTATGVRNTDGGTFVEDIDEIQHHSSSGAALTLPTSEDEEETAAEQIVGTKAQLEFVIEE